MAANPDPPKGWSLEVFQAFWKKPDLSWVPTTVHPDVVGYWPWSPTPVRGLKEYTQGVATVLYIVPDNTMDVVEHATNGDLNFIRWVAHGTGAKGPFEVTGVDRIRVKDGLLYENRIYFDSAHFRNSIGRLRVATRMLTFLLKNR
jgi:hypothetical protein